MNAESPGSAYRLFSLILLPFWLLHAIWHGRSQDLASYFRYRLGGYTGHSQKAQIWVHASSVGEVIAVTPIVESLRAKGESILFTSFTASGFKTIQRNFSGGVDSAIIPIDFIFVCQHFLRRHSIKLCLLMETELWPELLFQTAKRKIPIVQINARLSSKTADAPIFIRYLLRRTLTAIKLHLTRNEFDRQCLIGLGAELEKIKIIGNLKLHFHGDETFERPVASSFVLLASSHEGEESLFMDERPTMLQNHLIVIAPRHPTRSKAIQQYLEKSGIRFAVRSQRESVQSDTQVYLADTLGELKAFMSHAEVVVMGGSFDQTGGHNLIEPANLGCAIITGPSDSNIRSDLNLLGDAVIQVETVQQCWQQIDHLLSDPQQRQRIGELAQNRLRTQADVIERYLAEINPYL